MNFTTDPGAGAAGAAGVTVPDQPPMPPKWSVGDPLTGDFGPGGHVLAEPVQFVDSITPTLIPAQLRQFAALYGDGNFGPAGLAAARLFGHTRFITFAADAQFEIQDFEPGNPCYRWPGMVSAYLQDRQDMQKRGRIYTDLSNLGKASSAAEGLHHHWWLAWWIDHFAADTHPTRLGTHHGRQVAAAPWSVVLGHGDPIPPPPSLAEVLAEVRNLTGIELDPASVWAIQYANGPSFDVSALYRSW